MKTTPYNMKVRTRGRKAVADCNCADLKAEIELVFRLNDRWQDLDHGRRGYRRSQLCRIIASNYPHHRKMVTLSHTKMADKLIELGGTVRQVKRGIGQDRTS